MGTPQLICQEFAYYCLLVSVHLLLVSVHRFVEDKVNFGFNTDDSGIIGITLNHEYAVAGSQLGLTEEQLVTTVFNAARSCFLPAEEKRLLLQTLEERLKEYRKMANRD